MAVKKFDMQKTTEALKDRLEAMQKAQKPGQAVGQGSKMEVLSAMIGDLKNLVSQGYTPAQIAEAISHGDDFKILPKSITQVLNKAGNKAARKPARKPKDSKHGAIEADATAKPAPAAASFVVTPDSEDL